MGGSFSRAKSGGRAAPLDDEPSDFQSTTSRRPPPSTNISSPVLAMSKKRKAGSTISGYVDEEDEETMSGFSGHGLHRNGYERDDFVVSDEEADEEDAFEAVPPRRQLPPSRQRQQTLDELGPPISRDARLEEAGIDEIHQDIVHAFVDKASEVEENLRNRHGLRRALFTEQQYREMAIRWTTSVAKMYTIRGVDTTKVDLYGAKFAALVQKFHNQYLEMMGKSRYPAATVASKNNKTEVVDLISDEEDYGMKDGAGFGDEEDVDEDDDEDEDEEAFESSRFFSGTATARAPSLTRSEASNVQQWHKRFEELSKPPAKKSSSSQSASTATSTSNRPSNASWRGGKKAHYSKKGGAGGGGPSFSRTSSAGGVSKRRSSTNRQFGRGVTPAARARSKTPASKARSKRPSGSGISLMPH